MTDASWLGARTATPHGAVWPRLEAGDQQHVDDLNGFIGKADTDGAAGRRLGHEFRVLHRKRHRRLHFQLFCTFRAAFPDKSAISSYITAIRGISKSVMYIVSP